MSSLDSGRDGRLLIDPALIRCAPSLCPKKASCARYLAPIPRGGIVQDFSYVISGRACQSFVSVSDAKQFRVVVKSGPKEWIGKFNQEN